MKARLPDGYGKQDVGKMMQQVQEMQAQMGAKQEELENTEYTAKAAGGLVEVVMRGDYNLTSVRLDKEAVDPDDLEMLEDMIAAAVNEAVRTVKDGSAAEMAKISEAFPGLANLPV